MNVNEKVEQMRKLAIPMVIVYAVLIITATVLSYFSGAATLAADVLTVIGFIPLLAVLVFAYYVSYGTTAVRAFRFIVIAYAAQLVDALLILLVDFFHALEILGIIELLVMVVEVVFIVMGFTNLYRSMRYDPNFYRDNSLRAFIWTTVGVIVLKVILTKVSGYISDYIELGRAADILNYVFTAIIAAGNFAAQLMLALFVKNYRLDPAVPFRYVERKRTGGGGFGVTPDESAFRNHYGGGASDGGSDSADDPFSDLGEGDGNGNTGYDNRKDDNDGRNGGDRFNDDLFN